MPCPRCGARKFWTLKNGRRRCARCRYDWKPDRLPLRLTRRQWRALLEWFVRGMTSAQIAQETHLERKRILRALTIVRSAMLDAAPVRARPLGHRWHADHAHSGERTDAVARHGRPRPAVIGLRLAGEQVWAEVVVDEDAEWLIRSLRERRHGSGVIGPSTLDYGAIVYRNRLYRLPTSVEGGAPAPFGYLEGFWAYLHQRLRSKGGIRRGRLGLYLAEYGWRYNHRRLTPREQIRELFKLIGPRRPGVRTAPFTRDSQPDYKGEDRVIR
jgi:transposase